MLLRVFYQTGTISLTVVAIRFWQADDWQLMGHYPKPLGADWCKVLVSGSDLSGAAGRVPWSRIDPVDPTEDSADLAQGLGGRDWLNDEDLLPIRTAQVSVA